MVELRGAHLSKTAKGGAAAPVVESHVEKESKLRQSRS